MCVNQVFLKSFFLNEECAQILIKINCYFASACRFLYQKLHEFDKLQSSDESYETMQIFLIQNTCGYFCIVIWIFTIHWSVFVHLALSCFIWQYIIFFKSMKLFVIKSTWGDWFGLVWFYSRWTIVDYLMPNPLNTYIWNIWFVNTFCREHIKTSLSSFFFFFFFCTQLNGFKYCYLIRIILFTINRLFAHC